MSCQDFRGGVHRFVEIIFGGEAGRWAQAATCTPILQAAPTERKIIFVSILQIDRAHGAGMAMLQVVAPRLLQMLHLRALTINDVADVAGF